MCAFFINNLICGNWRVESGVFQLRFHNTYKITKKMPPIKIMEIVSPNISVTEGGLILEK